MTIVAQPEALTARGAPPPARDLAVDAARALGTLGVVALHWLMLDGAWDGGSLVMGNALGVGHAWVLTWLVPLPLLFFAAGAGAGYGLGRPGSPAVRGLRRLAPPVGLFAAAWSLTGGALLAAGLPGQAVGAVLRTVPQPLWFLVVYLGLVALAPAAGRALARFGPARVLAAVAAGALAVDALRFAGGVPAVEWANVALVWAVPFVAGLAWARRAGDGPGRGVLVTGVLVGFVGAVALVAAGPYPPSIVGLPGAPVSNLNPPTAPVLLLAVAQVCAVLLARDALARWAGGRGAGTVGWLSAHATTVYLWHLTAMFAVAGFALVGLGERLPEPWSADWWASRPVWFGTMALVLAGLVRCTAWAERRGRAAGRAAAAGPYGSSRSR